MKRKLVLILMSVFIAVLAFAVPRDMCVVEIGTGTWCQYCPGAAMAADDLESNGINAAIIEYHNGDTYVNAASNARNTYYNITGFPTGFFDGLQPIVGGNHTTSMYPSYLVKVNARLAIPSNFLLYGTASILGSTMTVQAVAKKVEQNANSNIKMHIVLTESDIMVNWQGQNHVSFVERAMFPDNFGSDISFSEGPRQTVLGNIPLTSSWVQDNMEVVIFIQDNTTKEILQGTKFRFTEIAKIPSNLTAQLVNGNHVLLNWQDPLTTPLGYAVYKNDEFLDFADGLNTNYTDPTELTAPATYKVTSLFETGESLFTIEITVLPVGNDDNVQVTPIPSTISSIYPNPCRSNSKIYYSLNNSGSVQINVYNVLGQEVRQITNANQSNGYHTAYWDGKDNNGNDLSNGIYFVRLLSKDAQDTKKIMLLK